MTLDPTWMYLDVVAYHVDGAIGKYQATCTIGSQSTSLAIEVP